MMTTIADMQVVVSGIAKPVPRSEPQLPERHMVMAAAVVALLPIVHDPRSP